MSKFKKYIIIIVLLIVLISLCGLYYYKNYMYSLEKVSFMLNSVQFPSNIHIVYKSYYADKTEPNSIVNYYIKENKDYMVQEDGEQKENGLGKIEHIYDYDVKKNIIIFHGEKSIASYKYEEMIPRDMPLKMSFFLYVEQHGLYEHKGKYEFHGKEIVNGKKCIKVSFTDEYDEDVSRYYFYIDLETNFIIKFEVYNGNSKDTLEKTITETYEYYPNTVTDDDILKFDKNNYPDYEFYEE